MSPPDRPRPGPLLVTLAYVGFISLGLPDALTGVAWPGVRSAFGLAQGSFGLVFVASGAGYFATSFAAGRLTRALGIGPLLAASTSLVAAALFGFAAAPGWGWFVACAVAHGLGSGAIDAGLNGFAAERLSPRQMNWLHACYCFGTMLGPLLMTAMLGSGRPYAAGYAAAGGAMLALAAVFLATAPRWGGTATASSTAPGGAAAMPVGMLATLGHPLVALQMAVFFLYTGLEGALGQWAYTVLTESRGVAPGAAGVAVGAYWASLGVGRVLAGIVADRVGPDRLIRLGLLVAAAGAAIFAVPAGVAGAAAGLMLAGLGLAPVFPALMTRTPGRLGPGLAAHAVGFQVGAAMVGVAALPGALGLLAGRVGLEAIPLGALALAVAVGLLHEALARRPDLAAGAGNGR